MAVEESSGEAVIICPIGDVNVQQFVLMHLIDEEIIHWVTENSDLLMEKKERRNLFGV